MYLVCRLLLERSSAYPHLHSFPTRRSSDLPIYTLAYDNGSSSAIVGAADSSGTLRFTIPGGLNNTPSTNSCSYHWTDNYSLNLSTYSFSGKIGRAHV